MRPTLRAEINVTPLVDVCLVLLIIIMVVTPLAAGDVKLPEATGPEAWPAEPHGRKSRSSTATRPASRSTTTPGRFRFRRSKRCFGRSAPVIRAAKSSCAPTGGFPTPRSRR